MADKMTMLVGTVGQGIIRSGDGGESWQRVGINQGLHSDALVRCVVNHPGQPEVLFSKMIHGFIFNLGFGNPGIHQGTEDISGIGGDKGRDTETGRFIYKKI